MINNFSINKKTNSKSQPVSIIIPCFNRARFLPNLINNLLSLNYNRYEIIIINDGSTDNTTEILKNLPIKTISVKNQIGSAKARNLGIMKAKFNIIALTDSDCYVSKNWLKDLVPYLEEYDLVGGKVVFYDEVENKLNPMIQKEEIIQKDSPINFLNTSNMLFRRDLWKNIGGFSNYRLEDVDFSWKALKKGKRLIYVPKGLVIHHGIRKPLENIKKYFQYGKSYSEIAFIQKINLSFKSEPIIDRKSISILFIIILISLLGIFILEFLNSISIFLIIIILSSLFIYINIYFLKKVKIFYALYKLSIIFSIIIFTIIFKLK